MNANLITEEELESILYRRLGPIEAKLKFMEKVLPPNLTKAQAAEYLNISESTIDRLSKPGKPLAPALKKEGKTCLYDVWLVYEYDRTRYVEPITRSKAA